MAILEEVPHLEVKIVSNNVSLAEYDDDDDEPTSKTVSKYIEATSGAEFGVQCTFTQPYPMSEVLVHVLLDGKRVCGKFVTRRYLVGSEYTFVEKASQYSEGNKGYEQNFCFSELTIDESDKNYSNDRHKNSLDHIGRITVKFFYVQNIRPSTKVYDGVRMKVNAVGPISEKSLKGKTLSHQAILGTPVPSTVRGCSDCDYIDKQKRPFATYNFNYRSRVALQSLLIVPRSPTPVPLEERNVDDLAPAEMRELLRRQRDREEALRAIKTERVKTERVKRERDNFGDIGEYADEVSFVSAKRRRGPPVIINDDGVEVLDLT